jgi:lactobin A/cerein 7B family class IIb bacteriocin
MNELKTLTNDELSRIEGGLLPLLLLAGALLLAGCEPGCIENFNWSKRING